jgi:hypothetical protein
LTRTDAAALAAFAAVACATLAPAWNAPGWPLSHDGPAFAQRTLVYARHLQQFDVVPIWSSADASGFGSPMPLFYHRLFYLLAAPVFLVTASAKWAILATLTIVLVGGAWGMHRLVRTFGAGQLAAAVAGACLIAANYTVTNWLVRGAVAELTAAMIVPWLWSAFVEGRQQGRMPLSLGVWLALLWHAHSVMAFYTVIVLAATLTIVAVRHPAAWTLVDPRTAWRPVGLFALLVAPNLLAMAVLGSRYDLSRFLSWPLHPSYQFRPLLWYFWDRHWTWGHTASGLTLQIDLPMLALLAIGVAAAIWRRRSSPVPLSDLATIALPAALCLVLQMHWTEPFYLHVPGAAYIQFPWRLLALLTPLLIALAITVADRALPHDLRLLALAGAAGWMVAGSGAFVPLADSRIPLDPPSLAGVSFSGYREYEPSAAARLDDARKAIEARWRDAGCTVERARPFDEEVVVVFDVSCARSATIPLPIYASRLHQVEVSRFGRRQPCIDITGVPAVCGAAVPAGESQVRVRIPTLAGIPGYVLRPSSGRLN